MSVSPPKEEVEVGGPSPENSDQMDRGDPESQVRDFYELDVKEQDRWLPIANGWFSFWLSCTIVLSFRAYPSSDAAERWRLGFSSFACETAPARMPASMTGLLH